MDLRKYQIPDNIGKIIKTTARQKENFISWYQPFIFSDDVIVGAGALWNYGANVYYCTEENSKKTRNQFLIASTKQGDYNNYINDVMLESFPTAETFLEFGCSNGHLEFDLTKRGKKYTGVDRERNRPSYELISKITGIEFEYIGDTYDEVSHSLKNLDSNRKFDCGILSVVLMHLADPQYAMGYLSKKIKQGIYFSSVVMPGNTHSFRARITSERKKMALPLSYELVPTEALGESLMRFAGFPFVYKIPYRKGVDPLYEKKRCHWVASREPISDIAIKKYNLQEMPNRIEKFADIKPKGFWGSKPPSYNSNFSRLKRFIKRLVIR